MVFLADDLSKNPSERIKESVREKLEKNSRLLYYHHDNCVCSNIIYYRSVTNLLPKSITIHILVVITEWSICKRATFQVHVIQFSHVCSHNLISINENHLHRKLSWETCPDCFNAQKKRVMKLHGSQADQNSRELPSSGKVEI